MATVWTNVPVVDNRPITVEEPETEGGWFADGFFTGGWFGTGIGERWTAGSTNSATWTKKSADSTTWV